MKRIALVASSLVLAACTVAPSPTPTKLAFPLPTDPRWVAGGTCLGTGTDAVIHGSPNDQRVTWATTSDGTRTEIVWPVGYSVRFGPRLEVLDPAGTVVAHEGDHLMGWCRTADTPAGQPIRVQGADVEPAPSPT